MKVLLQSPKGWRMETWKLEGGDGETYGGATGIATDIISHAAWSQDFFTPGQQSKERISPLPFIITIDNLLGVAALRHDPAIGQCVSYYKLMIEFRQDQGCSTFSVSENRKSCTSKFFDTSQSRSP